MCLKLTKCTGHKPNMSSLPELFFSFYKWRTEAQKGEMPHLEPYRKLVPEPEQTLRCPDSKP